MLDILFQLKQHQVIAASDYYFANMIAQKQQNLGYSEVERHLAVLLAALCSYSQRQGNTCLYLDSQLYGNLFDLAYRKFDDGRQYLFEIQDKINNTPIKDWQKTLQCHIAFTSTPLTQKTPLVFQHKALYFYRSWQDEYRVAQYLKSAVENSVVLHEPLPIEHIADILQRYFTETAENTHNWQKIAAAMALRQQCCLISGGPGTGKTYTVARLLAVIQELCLLQARPPLRIALAAPTGKAAARLTESIGRALCEMDIPAHINAVIPKESMTIHRLLGVRLFEEQPRFHRRNPLSVDLLVVDEASMIDLALMAKLLQALKPHAKLILLGDKDQLASVEAGAVIGELGQFISDGFSEAMSDYLWQTTQERLFSKVEGNPIRDHLCELKESRRFSERSGIGALAKAINTSAKGSWELFEQYEDIELYAFPEVHEYEDTAALQKKSLQSVLQNALEEYSPYLQHLQQIVRQHLPLNHDNLHEIFTRFNSVRFLTALRNGQFGLENLNQAIAEKLREVGLVNFKHSREWYIGKAVMITQNDSTVGLFNGDIGLYLGNSKVWFATANGYQSVSVSRIPNCEPAFAMTVHKSQGSEFDHTFLLLPLQPNPILSKELLYTAVTRAKKRLTLFSTKSIWESAVNRPIKRQSGLGKLLSINNFA